MKQLLICTFLCASFSSFSQKVFFKSNQKFSERQLENFYSAISLSDSLVIFNANDYTLYAYDKITGAQKWSYALGRKTNRLQYVSGGYLWTNADEYKGLRLDLNGKNPKEFPFSIYSKPFVKGHMVYLTGIYDLGNVLAYDLQADSVAWYKFIAHGCDIPPYYLKDRILANMEGNNWITINYDGSMSDKNCETSEPELMPEGCTEVFSLMTHDGKQLEGRLAETIAYSGNYEDDMYTTDKKTFILSEDMFTILGNRLKVVFSENLAELSEELLEGGWGPRAILRADEETAWLQYGNKLVIFDVKKKKIGRIVDLSSWRPHRILADGDRLWLVSKNDGLLYGLTID